MDKVLGANAEAEPTRILLTDRRKKINGFDCREAELRRGERVLEEVCIASASALDMPKADFATLQKMYALMTELQENGAPNMLPDYRGVDGVPIEIRDPRGGSQRLSTVTYERMPADHFVVPKDYQRESIMEALSRR
jgi:hypothetical protein